MTASAHQWRGTESGACCDLASWGVTPTCHLFRLSVSVFSSTTGGWQFNVFLLEHMKNLLVLTQQAQINAGQLASFSVLYKNSDLVGIFSKLNCYKQKKSFLLVLICVGASLSKMSGLIFLSF